MPPVIDSKKCIHCGTCATNCTMDVFGPYVKGTVPQVLYEDECWHCRACVIDCPASAITMRYPLPYMLLYQDANGKREGGTRI